MRLFRPAGRIITEVEGLLSVLARNRQYLDVEVLEESRTWHFFTS